MYLLENTKLWSALVAASSDRHQVKDLFQVVDQLSLDDKAALVKHLMGNAGLNIGFGNNQISGSVIAQINMMDKAALGETLQAIACRIATET